MEFVCINWIFFVDYVVWIGVGELIGYVEVNCVIGICIQLYCNIKVVWIVVFYNCEWELNCCVVGCLIDIVKFLRAGKVDFWCFFIFYFNNLSILLVVNGSNCMLVVCRVGLIIIGGFFYVKGGVVVVWIVVVVNVCYIGGMNYLNIFIFRCGIVIFIMAYYKWIGNVVLFVYILYLVVVEDFVV